MRRGIIPLVLYQSFCKMSYPNSYLKKSVLHRRLKPFCLWYLPCFINPAMVFLSHAPRVFEGLLCARCCVYIGNTYPHASMCEHIRMWTRVWALWEMRKGQDKWNSASVLRNLSFQCWNKTEHMKNECTIQGSYDWTDFKRMVMVQGNSTCPHPKHQTVQPSYDSYS